MAYEEFMRLDAEKHDRLTKALIGISRPNFDLLATAFAVAYAAIQLERVQRGEIKQVPSGGAKGHLDTFDKKLFFLLYYLKTYPTFDVLGFHFGLSSGHAFDHVAALLPVLLRSLADLGVLPARSPGTPDEFAQIVEQYGYIAIDGLECPCVRPQDDECQKARFSGKKTPYAQGDCRHDPTPSNPLPLWFLCRKPPRLCPHEKALRSPLEMVSPSEGMVGSWVSWGGH
jgi:hypothetical protein